MSVPALSRSLPKILTMIIGWNLNSVNEVARTVSIALNDGNGTFQTATKYGVGLSPSGLLSEDFDKDGKIDIAAANLGSKSITILKNNCAETLSIKSFKRE